jgi:cysteine desulfurase/selenocysteine lyase
MLTAESRRRTFPSLEEMVYLNTAAEGIPPLETREALEQYFLDKQLGMDGRKQHFAVLEEAKALVAELYGLMPLEIGICSCSSEAYNLAAMALRLRDGDEVIVNDLDFPAGVTPWLQPTCPANVHVWQAREGVLRVEDLRALLTPRTRLVTVSQVSFFNGYRIALPAVVEVVRRHSSALLAVDATQALGRIPLDLTGADLIVSSTHKWILASHGGGLVGVPSARRRLACTGWRLVQPGRRFWLASLRAGRQQTWCGGLRGGHAELSRDLCDPGRPCVHQGDRRSGNRSGGATLGPRVYRGTRADAGRTADTG